MKNKVFNESVFRKMFIKERENKCYNPPEKKWNLVFFWQLAYLFAKRKK